MLGFLIVPEPELRPMQLLLLELFGANARPTDAGVVVEYRCEHCGRLGCLGGEGCAREAHH